MVLLLPLRGWVGEAMAGQMMQERMAQVHAAVPPAHVHGEHQADHSHGDAQLHAASLAHHGWAPAGDGASSVHDDCGTCAACQVCSSVALSPTLPVVATGGFSQPRPDSPQRAYTSAEPLLAFKPPRG